MFKEREAYDMLGQLLALHETNPHGSIVLSNPRTGTKRVCHTGIGSVEPVVTQRPVLGALSR
jgi:hypothetical protein